MAYRPERGWGFAGKDGASVMIINEMEELRRRIAELEKNTKAGD